MKIVRKVKQIEKLTKTLFKFNFCWLSLKENIALILYCIERSRAEDGCEAVSQLDQRTFKLKYLRQYAKLTLVEMGSNINIRQSTILNFLMPKPFETRQFDFIYVGMDAFTLFMQRIIGLLKILVGQFYQVQIDLTLPMLPEILSLPVMKTVVGFRAPENILQTSNM